MPGRHYSNGDLNYRYGFGGEEVDNEIHGNGNSIAYMERMYDPRLGRWKSLDPMSMKYPDVSPYSYVINSPLVMKEIDGAIWGWIIKDLFTTDRDAAIKNLNDRAVWNRTRRNVDLFTAALLDSYADIDPTYLFTNLVGTYLVSMRAITKRVYKGIANGKIPIQSMIELAIEKSKDAGPIFKKVLNQAIEDLYGGTPDHQAYALGKLVHLLGVLAVPVGEISALEGAVEGVGEFADDGVKIIDEISNFADDAGAVEWPVLEFSASETPNIVENIESVTSGSPMELAREMSKSVIRANRNAALRGKPKAGAGMSLDEFPFASSKQGGAGAAVKAVPVREQSIQGGKMSQFYQRNGILDGDKFVVKTIP